MAIVGEHGFEENIEQTVDSNLGIILKNSLIANGTMAQLQSTSKGVSFGCLYESIEECFKKKN